MEFSGRQISMYLPFKIPIIAISNRAIVLPIRSNLGAFFGLSRQNNQVPFCVQYMNRSRQYYNNELNCSNDTLHSRVFNVNKPRSFSSMPM